MSRYIPGIKGCFTCPCRQYELDSGLSHCNHPETRGKDVSGWAEFPDWCVLPKEDDVERLSECVAKNEALNKIIGSDINLIKCLGVENDLLREMLLESTYVADDEFGDDSDFVPNPELSKILVDHHNTHDQVSMWSDGMNTIIDWVKNHPPVKADVMR